MYSKEVQSVILISLVYSILTIKVNYLGTKFVMQNTRLFDLIKGQLISKCLFDLLILPKNEFFLY